MQRDAAMSGRINHEIEECIRNNVTWQALPRHLQQVLNNTAKDYDRLLFNYCLRNQLRYRGHLVRQIFHNEQRYYELLVEKSVTSLSLFPYHLADIITKGLRVTPFNYYIDVLSYLLKNDRSYDTLPNFTAADCLRVLGIGRNEYLALISELKTNTSRIQFRKPNPQSILPKFPVRIHIEPWWKVEIGYVLETDIKFVNEKELGLLDDLIDFGSLTAGKINYHVLQSLYRKGLIYLDVPISGEDRISIPPLKNFVMNRVSGDYFENLLYKLFVSTDEHTTISELANMLQINLDTVKQAISFFCRLGFAQKITENAIVESHISWDERNAFAEHRVEVTPLNFHALLLNESSTGLVNSTGSALNDSGSDASPKIRSADEASPKKVGFEPNSTSNESDGNVSDFSIISPSQTKVLQKSNSESPVGGPAGVSDADETSATGTLTRSRGGKRVLFLFDATLTAFLMMGNLSPGLKNHAVTMFEVGKLSNETMDTFLAELEKVSLLDAEGEGEVSRYFAHAVILRSTIIALRNMMDAGLDLMRLECLESFDHKTRDRLLEKNYKFIISASPLTSAITNTFSIPFFGQFFRSSDNTHLWTKLFYYHMSGYGPPSLLLTKGTVLKSLPRLFLGYGKLLITIVSTDSYVIHSENYRTLNDALRNGCMLVQGYGIRNPATIHYEAFPIQYSDSSKSIWGQHKAITKLSEQLNLNETCGYMTFANTGVPDIGCEEYDVNVHLRKPKNRTGSFKERRRSSAMSQSRTSDVGSVASEDIPSFYAANVPDLRTPADGSEITSFSNTAAKAAATDTSLKSPDENHFAVTPQNRSPANDFRSDDCNELLARELADLDEAKQEELEDAKCNLVSQASIEIDICDDEQKESNGAPSCCDIKEEADVGEDWTILDVHFGVPLFDVDCNTRICEYIVKHLSKDEILERLSTINADMNKKFLKFVAQCLHFENNTMELIKVGRVIPQPQINIAFENGRVCYWNGK